MDRKDDTMAADLDFNKMLSHLSIEEKIAQKMVFGWCGSILDNSLLRFIDQYGLGGLRVTQNGARKADARYSLSAISKDSVDPAADPDSLELPLEWGEKTLNIDIPAPIINGDVYARLLNVYKKRAFERNGLVLHTVADFEGATNNFPAPYLISPPNAMSLGRLGDYELVERLYNAMARQLKALGIDWIHSPVADVNVNPENPEISTRSFGADPAVVTAGSRALIKGCTAAGLVTSMKHFPGRGDSMQDAHYSVPSVDKPLDILEAIHTSPYRTLIAEGVVPSIMLAHTVYPALDDSGDIATCSGKIVTDYLRKELGFDGVITSDSLTMGGLINKYSLTEACILNTLAGGDLLLMKAENALRTKVHAALVDAVKSGRIPEDMIDESLIRIWKLKARFGMFENANLTDDTQTNAIVADPAARAVGREAAEKVLHVMRNDDQLWPLDDKCRLLVVEHVTDNHKRRNQFWNYPGIINEFLQKYTENFTYVEYDPKNEARAWKYLDELIGMCDKILFLGDYDRSCPGKATRDFAEKLIGQGKPVIYATSNPYRELMIPDNARNVIFTGGIMHEQYEALIDMLFGKLK